MSPPPLLRGKTCRPHHRRGRSNLLACRTIIRARAKGRVARGQCDHECDHHECDGLNFVHGCTRVCVHRYECFGPFGELAPLFEDP